MWSSSETVTLTTYEKIDFFDPEHETYHTVYINVQSIISLSLKESPTKGRIATFVLAGAPQTINLYMGDGNDEAWDKVKKLLEIKG